MFAKMIAGALLRRWRRTLMIGLTVALGASLATAMLNVLLDTGDKVSKELKSYGANITVTPRAASLARDLYGAEGDPGVGGPYLKEQDVAAIKTIFWANNIVAFAPFLEVRALVGPVGTPVTLAGTWFQRSIELPTGQTVEAGARLLKPWWEVDGAWPDDADRRSVLVGKRLARKLAVSVGDRLSVRGQARGAESLLTVQGILDSGGPEDEQLLVPLEGAQDLAGLPDSVQRIEVSALTTPDNELARRAARNPKSLGVREWETWYCTAYVSSIAYQIEEVVAGSRAKALRQVAESEGLILRRTLLLMLLITASALVAAALGISNLVTAGVLERSSEIGLLKALGATDRRVSLLIVAETASIGLAGGAIGYAAGIGLAWFIGRSVFGTAVAINGMVIPAVCILLLIVVLGGCLPALRLLLSLRPSQVLHGR